MVPFMVAGGTPAGSPPADASTSNARAAMGTASPPSSPALCKPASPALCKLVEPEAMPFNFIRSISGASTELPDAHVEHLHSEHFNDDAWGELSERHLPALPIATGEQELALEEGLAEVKVLYRRKYGRDIEDESEEEEWEYEFDTDGTAWIKTIGTGPLTVQVLEARLAEVKELFMSTFGQDVDEESNGSAQELAYDGDGTLWIKTVGTGPLTVPVLEERLEEVKELFSSKFGQNIDEESEEDAGACERDEDGTPWIKTVGTGPLTVPVLEERLEEVKELFSSKFGHSVDEESEEDAGECERDEDGTPWIKTVGVGPLTVSALEERLVEVKELYKSKYGLDLDAEDDEAEHEYREEGTPGIEIVGSGLPKMGNRDVCAESGDVLDVAYDEDGTLWVNSVGTWMVTNLA